jgi:hypothetical protein
MRPEIWPKFNKCINSETQKSFTIMTHKKEAMKTDGITRAHGGMEKDMAMHWRCE